MSIVFYFIFMFFGVLIGSLGLIQIVVILKFNFPFTEKMSKLGILTDKRTINKRAMMTLILWSVIILLSIILICLFAARSSLVSFMLGVGLSLLFGFNRTGENEANIQDYMTANQNFINLDELKNVDEKVRKYESELF
jgi:hypothetical protein